MTLSIGCTRFSNRGTVEKPFIGAANTESLSFEKVVLTDSNTVLHAVIHFRPHWWFRVADSSAVVVDGKKYMMTGLDGIKVNEKNFMPDSGVMHFTMTFPAIPADAKSLSFVEDVPSGYYIGDIDLTGEAGDDYYLRRVPAEMRKDYVDGPMPEPVFAYDTTTVNLHILGYYPGFMDARRLITTLHGQEVSDKPVPVDDNGNAQIKLALAGPASLSMLFDGANRFSHAVTLKPGETVDVYVDPHLSGVMNMAVRDGVEDMPSVPTAYHNGYYANYDRMRRAAADMPYYQLFEYDADTPYYRMTGDEYTDFLIGNYKAFKDSIDASDMPQMCKEYRKNELMAMLYAGTFGYESIVRSNYYNKHDAWGTKIPQDSIKTELSPENISRLAELIDVNDAKLLMPPYDYTMGNFGEEMWRGANVDPGLIGVKNAYYNAYEKASEGELDDSELAALRAMNEGFATDAEKHNEYMKAKLAALDYSAVTPTPDVSADKLIETIVKPHRGKVVMVDLWNTWCGPCRAALAENEPNKSAELSSDDIVWIYIADETSSAPKYIEMIQDIKGIHYMLTQDQIGVIRNQFEVDGIPYYILVDKTGKATGRPDLRDHEKFKKTILEELAK